jgi:hypothetical protein
MGFELGSLFNLLYNEIIWLHYKWSDFEELYGTKESRINLINQSAPFFFFIVQKVLWENILLGIARITDPVKSRGKRNITIQALPDFLNDEKLKAKLKLLISEIIEKTKFSRDWRNRRISHYDFDLSINKEALPLEVVNRLLIKKSLELILEVINLLLSHYFKSTLLAKTIKTQTGSLALLHVLRDGQKERENYIKRIRTGQFYIDDNDSNEI